MLLPHSFALYNRGMQQATDSKLAQIFFSCTAKQSKDGEQFIAQHVLDYIIAGTGEVYYGGKCFTYKAGDFRFVRRNRITKFVKHPPQEGEYQSITVCIDQETLRHLNKELRIDNIKHIGDENVILLKPHKLLTSYINSLSPYLNSGQIINKNLLKAKVNEAVMILLETNPSVSSLLFDFNDPGKIDLEAYMGRHYKFNGSLSQFAYLTGRSLSTFKRDFARIFHTTPNRWLLNKRLEEAYYLIKEKHWKATDAFLEVGFKDYSHFSVAFKKAFGCAPSLLKV